MPRLVRVIVNGFIYHHAFVTETTAHTHYSMKRVLLFHPEAANLVSEVIDMSEWQEILATRVRHDH